MKYVLRVLCLGGLLLPVLFWCQRLAHKAARGQKWAMVTYCSCDANGCLLYERSNRLKDFYCQRNNCDHLVYFFPAHVASPLPGENCSFSDHVLHKGTSVAAMWGTVKSLLLALNDPRKYEWVFVTGGDQIIVRGDVPLENLLPLAARNLNFDIFIPMRGSLVPWGLMSPPIVRNTEFARRFVRHWWQFSCRGNYLVEDQSVMNMLIVAELTRDKVVPKEFEWGGSCSPWIPRATYDFGIVDALGKGKALRTWSECNRNWLDILYGQRPYSSFSRGWKTKVCLFEVVDQAGQCPVDLKDCGFNWNGAEGVFGNNIFMWHLAGHKTFDRVDRTVDQVMRVIFPNVSLSSPSIAFSRCVESLMPMKRLPS